MATKGEKGKIQDDYTTKEPVRNADMACGERHFETWNPGDCLEYDTHHTGWTEAGWNELIATGCNANGLDGDNGLAKLTTIMCLMEGRNIDYMSITDTRLSKIRSDKLRKAIRRYLGKGAVVMASPVRDNTEKEASLDRTGGILVIVRPRWGLAIVGNQADNAGMGELHATTLQYSQGSIRLIVSYWPCRKGKKDNGLYNKTQRWMRNRESAGTPTVSILKMSPSR